LVVNIEDAPEVVGPEVDDHGVLVSRTGIERDERECEIVGLVEEKVLAYVTPVVGIVGLDLHQVVSTAGGTQTRCQV